MRRAWSYFNMFYVEACEPKIKTFDRNFEQIYILGATRVSTMVHG